MSARRNIVLIAGARPNFMKVAPIMHQIDKDKQFRAHLIHTGQHYDLNMSETHFKDLSMPKPGINLGVGSGSHSEQTAAIMLGLEKSFVGCRPDLVVVVGDVNSTVAAALVAAKMKIPLAHVEAGLRSKDREMPEEINRLVTDTLSDILYTHCLEANKNLAKEGVSKSRVKFVGNVMIDTLYQMLSRARLISPPIEGNFGLITLHRPSNVDEINVFRGIFESLEEIAVACPLVFPVHPRTKAQLEKAKVLRKGSAIRLLEPMSYLPFLSAMYHSKIVLTDSGGIQEETTALGVPCLTLRKNTERMITVREGTNLLVGTDPSRILREAQRVLRCPPERQKRPKYWDGRASERIHQHLKKYFQ